MPHWVPPPPPAATKPIYRNVDTPNSHTRVGVQWLLGRLGSSYQWPRYARSVGMEAVVSI